MKKTIYSIIVIISTIISVSFMSYLDSSVDSVNGFQLHEVNSQEASGEYVVNKIEYKNKDIIENKTYQTNKIDDEKIVMEEKDSNYNSSNGVKENNYKEIVETYNKYNCNDSYNYYSSSEKVNSNKTTTKYTSEEEIADLLNEQTATVFKINKNTIPSKISNKDKLKMLKMANSLSIKDYKAVAENIKRSDELPAATDIFSILRDKLSSENYNELKKILNPYIDIDLIEKNIDEINR